MPSTAYPPFLNGEYFVLLVVGPTSCVLRIPVCFQVCSHMETSAILLYDLSHSVVCFSPSTRYMYYVYIFQRYVASRGRESSSSMSPANLCCSHLSAAMSANPKQHIVHGPLLQYCLLHSKLMIWACRLFFCVLTALFVPLHSRRTARNACCIGRANGATTPRKDLLTNHTTKQQVEKEARSFLIGQKTLRRN